MTTTEILSLLKDVKKTGDTWSAICPAHDDKNPSLGVRETPEGNTLLKCRAGCETVVVCTALGIALADLFSDKSYTNGMATKIVAEYDYKDADGNLRFQVCRFAPKDFRQRRPDGKGGWIWNMEGIKRVLFGVPETIAAIKAGLPIFICEGEKDVLAMQEHGFAATCNPGGAGKWQSSYSEMLRGADVVIIADKDKPGRKHAQDVARKLLGVVRSVKTIECPDVDGKTVKDAADYFAAGGQASDLDARAQSAPFFVEPEQCTAGLLQPEIADFAAVTAWIRGKILESMQNRDTPTIVKHSAVATHVVTALAQIGRFYFNSDLKDFNSAMFFDANRKRLERICSDSFSAWLAEWLTVNRATGLFKFILSAVETAALSGAHTTGILPESFWAARPGALYFSNGDGGAVKITAWAVEPVDNGTDGVLFAVGRTLAPWKLVTPRDPFKSCALLRNAHCGAAHGKTLLQLWLYSFATLPRSKPPLAAIGEIGAGKTRTLKGMAELYGIPFRAAKVEEQLEHNFWPNVNVGGLFILDNADSKCRWLPDAVAAAATDGSSPRRKLYTDSETVLLRANSWLAVTSANPAFGNDPGLTDRLLVVRMERTDGEASDAALTDEILAHRDAGLSHIAATLQKALADTGPTPQNLNARHPDFAAFAVKIGRALGCEADTIAALKAAEADKSAFCLENDSIASALVAYLRGVRSFTGTAGELAAKLVEIDADLKDRLSAKRLGKRLVALWPHLRKLLADCRKETDRTGVLHFTFAVNADFAGFQTDFSQNP